MSDSFTDIIRAAPVIEMREPLAALLGAFRDGYDRLAYSLADAVKLAGHCCPTVTGAFMATRAALAELYVDEIPVRGEVAVMAGGHADEGVYGVMSQVMTLVTGAAPETGFKGLAGRYRRQGLLTFDAVAGGDGSTFIFRRQDNGRAVEVRLYPWLVPFPEEKARRMAALLEKVADGSASDEESAAFRTLWMEKVAVMLETADDAGWLEVDVRREAE